MINTGIKIRDILISNMLPIKKTDVTMATSKKIAMPILKFLLINRPSVCSICVLILYKLLDI